MGKTLVIAEPGCTHEGNFNALVKLLHTAADCGADVFKPQWVSDPVQMCERRHMRNDPSLPASNPKFANAAEEFAYYEQAYRWNSFPVEWHGELKRLCTERGLQYACTAFLPQDVATIAPFVDYLKISSFESVDLGMIEAVRGLPTKGKNVRHLLVSSGMGGEFWTMKNRANSLTNLHCVSAYPAPLEQMNLRCVRHRRHVGLSDHSRNVLTGAVAVGAGASVIETHFRFSDCDPANPDYDVAFAPSEFAQYVWNIRQAERMIGDGVKRVQSCENWALPYRVTG